MELTKNGAVVAQNLMQIGERSVLYVVGNATIESLYGTAPVVYLIKEDGSDWKVDVGGNNIVGPTPGILNPPANGVVTLVFDPVSTNYYIA